jgi:hypothetical protein
MSFRATLRPPLLPLATDLVLTAAARLAIRPRPFRVFADEYFAAHPYYTLGKLQIYKLREDFRRATGSKYTLQGFHDALVKQAALRIKLLRQILVPGDQSPTL